ncbi:MAG: bifunctional glutathionylspermidine amidase/synthase [Paraglaciecola sp.]|uniref:bifunctional glutathionylspermidine amidase/synthase n=1 Tax=Paraglaciecola sp. TaxID=1920173 RepID=UPI00273EFA22|nr:bifunctional glutathionylspermidine amidase/synthase [Paraglaciecola sp.]MDP5032153.1 bifunctional glutathionylspermidine amidase/synthase [Paraglaciecola sp.]MDP5132926.1 bifunctional glutathionylspermidine amidase/synthase [Paraglaciecola sp.]
MPPKLELGSTPFGTLLGTAPGGVASYSSDYDTADQALYPNRSAYRSYFDGIYMGYKWQCVEFARRWLYVNQGYIFNDVSMAYEIFNLRSVREIASNELLPLQAFKNGAQRHPEVGSLLIWEEGGEFVNTGHVAIITEVSDSYVRIVEQNMDFVPWPDGRDYSREIKVKIGREGDFWIECSFSDATILGWMIQTADTTHAELSEPEQTELFNLKPATAHSSSHAFKPWLNIANDDEAAYVDMMKGHWLTSVEDDHLSYYMMSQSAQEALESATDELHGLFMHATDYVLQHDELLYSFGLPDSILPRIRQSWDNRLNQLITSRFDFSLSEQGLKVYEYNCDSASCYMETGKVQGKWAKHLGLKHGEDAGAELFAELVKAWRESEVEGLVHVLQDTDPEEDYHALFMLSAIEAAGHKCVRVVGLSSLSWNEQGDIVDTHGNKVKWVWKTWAWETALDQLRTEQDEQQAITDKIRPPGSVPNLSDVLLRQEIMVFEPLWTLIPSNKAILPVLWSLFPNHPLLLNTSFELSPELEASGYVVKPIVGRCGANIQLIDKDNKVLADKGGAFGDRTQIYQQLFPLPKVGKYYVQVCTFTAAGNYAGSGVRVDRSMIIGKDSDCMALRIDDDLSFLDE